jgi:cysteine desulfurase family protein (TIGR01976 family)
VSLDIEFVRSQFPALSGEWTFFDNAGGSQTLSAVAQRVYDYLIECDVQHGASYAVSRTAEERVRDAERALALFVRASDASEVIVGPSTSALVRMLARSVGRTLAPGDEIIVTNCDHEANVGPWVDLEERGVVVRFWKVNADSLALETEDLAALLNERTRLVAATHASNVLGTVNPIREWANLVHAAGALLCVDGVAYAPHRLVDVRETNVDFYVFSLYKVYGPHLALMYGKREHLLRMPSENHFFLADDEIPYKFQPGSRNYELTSGAGAIVEYLARLRDVGASVTRASLAESFAAIASHEAALGRRFLEWLAAKPRVRVIGDPAMGASRVPTISFVVDGVDSASIPPVVDLAHIGIRWGDFYARRLIDDLGLADRNGVVRVSMVHYNTLEEVDRLIEALDPVI